ITIIPKADQTINFPSPGNQVYGVGPITLNATASSGLAVSYSVTSGPGFVSGSTLNITGTGNITVVASQAGSAAWNPAPDVAITISVAAKTLTVSGITAA